MSTWYSYQGDFKLEHACTIFLDTYTRSPELEQACTIFKTHILGPQN